MRIVFFGNPDFCFYPLKKINNSSYNLVSVVTSTDRKSGRGLKFVSTFVKKTALEFNIPVIEVDDIKSKEFENKLISLKADLFVVVAFKFLPDSIINIPKYGSINIHPSLLPKYRGSSPIQYALLNGDSETGVSIIHLNNKIDSGAILGQKKINISPYANFQEMYEKLGQLSSELLITILKDMSNGTSKPIIQDESKKTLAPKIKKEQYRIDWQKKSLEIHNQIRAFDPYPGAYSFLNKKRIKLFLSKNEDNFKYANVSPGQLIFSDGLLFISAKQGFVSVKEIQLEGKKRINASDFIKTLKDKIYILD